mgnify:CR=1 FL=1
MSNRRASSGRLFGRLRNQPVLRLILICMAIVAVLPIGLLTMHLHDAAWQDSWREIREKHQLLAENLSAPIGIYIADQRELLRLLSHTIGSAERPQSVLEDVLFDTSGFAALALVRRDGQVLGLAHRDAGADADREPGDDASQPPTHSSPQQLANEPCFIRVRDQREPFISGIKRSPLSGRASVLVGQPVFVQQDGAAEPALIAVLLGELRLDLIEKLRSGIQFGELGHSAIVDQHGRVVAHPNGDWVVQMRDLSKLSVVREMMAGRTGVIEFYSPHMKADMVAGYTAVPEIGWGVMVPQPKAEVQMRIDAMMVANYRWISSGLLLAAALGVAMTFWIISPINRLAQDASRLVEDDLDGAIRDAGGYAPREVRQLGSALARLVARLQGSRREVERLNADLQSRIAEATSQLLEANKRLAVAADSDHLTGLANRRYFEREVVRIRAERRGRPAQRCVMLVDIDHFKRINDGGGHALGDRALQRVAEVLAAQMRGDDLLARYGGDEFAAYLDGDSDQAARRAERIRQAVADSKLGELLADTDIDESSREMVLEALGGLTVSIGLYCHAADAPEDIETIMQRADEAMYRAKHRGRNQVVSLNSGSTMLATD